jgi:hypothetical protein
MAALTTLAKSCGLVSGTSHKAALITKILDFIEASPEKAIEVLDKDDDDTTPDDPHDRDRLRRRGDTYISRFTMKIFVKLGMRVHY